MVELLGLDLDKTYKEVKILGVQAWSNFLKEVFNMPMLVLMVVEDNGEGCGGPLEPRVHRQDLSTIYGGLNYFHIQECLHSLGIPPNFQIFRDLMMVDDYG